jgi:spore germination cell wall hydrolase CwlJ-like protein
MKNLLKVITAISLGMLSAGANTPLAVSKQYTLVDLHCLAKVVYWESRGEPPIGQLWVAQVVMNRVNHPKWPQQVCLVTKQPKQFHQPKHQIKDPYSWQQAQDIALVAMTTPPQHPYHYFYSKPQQKLFRHYFHNANL